MENSKYSKASMVPISITHLCISLRSYAMRHTVDTIKIENRISKPLTVHEDESNINEICFDILFNHKKYFVFSNLVSSTLFIFFKRYGGFKEKLLDLLITFKSFASQCLLQGCKPKITNLDLRMVFNGFSRVYPSLKPLCES